MVKSFSLVVSTTVLLCLLLAQKGIAFSTVGTTTPLFSLAKKNPRHNNHIGRCKVSALAARPRRRNPNNNSNSDGDEDALSPKSEIPQLPSFGSSSFDAVASVKRKFSDQEQPPAAFVGRKFELQYTCKVCETRNVHKVSRIAYNKGVVITVCKGCMSQHLISDHLGFTQQFDGNLEDYLKQQGSEETVTRVSHDVFNLEKILGLDTKSGSIFGPDGTASME